MNALSTRETRTVARERNAHRVTAFERSTGVRVRRPGRGNARKAAIHASVVGVF